MYKSKHKKPSQFDFDLIVIGSGPGGGVSAHLAAQKNKTVGLIEGELLGGDSINFSAIPTRALLKTAETLGTIKKANAFGIRSTDAHINFVAAIAWRNRAINSTGINDESKIFKSEGIKVIKGFAKFLNPWTITVGHRHYTAKKFIIATGSHSFIPNIPGLTEAGYITYKDVSNLPKIPKSVFIIGGGATTYEYAQIFCAFGSKIHIAETKRHILPHEDPEVSDLAQSELMNKGAHVYCNAHVLSITSNPNGTKNVIFEQYGKKIRAVTEVIMIAAGQLPNIDLDLPNANINFTELGIITNRFTGTSQKHIYAVGNVNGRTYYANAAAEEARIAVHNLYNRKKVVMNYSAIPHCFYGQPEIAIIGKNENDLRLTCQIYQTSIAPIGILDGAIINDYDSGFIKILATHTGVIVGASIVAPHASAMIDVLTLAITKQMRACEIAKLIYSFGVWNEAIRIAASKIKCI